MEKELEHREFPRRFGYDVVGTIMDYEQGVLSDEQTIDLFQHLIDSGTIYSLQGSYQRMAQRLYEEGMVTFPKRQRVDGESRSGHSVDK